MIHGNLETFWSRVAKSIAHLGCDTDAGKFAAIGAVDRLLAGRGLGYLDLADRVSGKNFASAATPTGYATPPSFGDLARWTRDLDRGQLTSRERAFVADMCRRGFSFRPSLRQEAWLTSLFDRLRGRAAA